MTSEDMRTIEEAQDHLELLRALVQDAHNVYLVSGDAGSLGLTGRVLYSMRVVGNTN